MKNWIKEIDNSEREIYHTDVRWGMFVFFICFAIVMFLLAIWFDPDAPNWGEGAYLAMVIACSGMGIIYVWVAIWSVQCQVIEQEGVGTYSLIGRKLQNWDVFKEVIITYCDEEKHTKEIQCVILAQRHSYIRPTWSDVQKQALNHDWLTGFVIDTTESHEWTADAIISKADFLRFANNNGILVKDYTIPGAFADENRKEYFDTHKNTSKKTRRLL